MPEKFSIDVDNIKLVGELFYPPNTEKPLPALCICHGIPSGKPHGPADGGYPELAARFAGEGFLTCIFNFRGAGESGGNLDMMGWTRDLDVVISYVMQIKEVDISKFSLMGFSGGAAASAYVTAHDIRVSALVLCACPADFSPLIGAHSMGELIKHHRSIGTIRDAGFPPSQDKWGDNFRQVSPISQIDRISPRPLLIIHGEHDDLIDANQAQSLYQKAKDPKEILLVPDAGHQLRKNEQVITASIDWLKKVNIC